MIHICMYMYIYIHICAYVYKHIHVYIHIYIYITYICVYIYIPVSMLMLAYMHGPGPWQPGCRSAQGNQQRPGASLDGCRLPGVAILSELMIDPAATRSSEEQDPYLTCIGDYRDALIPKVNFPSPKIHSWAQYKAQ